MTKLTESNVQNESQNDRERTRTIFTLLHVELSNFLDNDGFVFAAPWRDLACNSATDTQDTALQDETPSNVLAWIALSR